MGVKMFNLDGKIALVTGGSRGIGAAAARLLAEAGCDVAITYRKDVSAAEEVLEEIAVNGSCGIAIKAELSDSAAAKRVVKETVRGFGRIDILVNNAGIWKGGAVDELSDREWIETIDINLNGLFFITRETVRVMKKQKWGRIINISSTAGQRGEAYHSHYAASKGAVISFTKSLCTELGEYNINVNAIAPGWVDTDMSAGIVRNAKAAAAIRKGIPIGRIATPEDIAGPIVFLASDLANHITGEILNVNGGSVLVG